MKRFIQGEDRTQATMFPASFVCLEPRLLPSIGITRLRQYYEPLRDPKASGWSSLHHAMGFSVLRRFPCVHAVATTPAQQRAMFFAQCSTH
jgi:hypothetical protein